MSSSPSDPTNPFEKWGTNPFSGFKGFSAPTKPAVPAKDGITLSQPSAIGAAFGLGVLASVALVLIGALISATTTRN